MPNNRNGSVEPAVDPRAPPPSGRRLEVVGVGASAGGLDAVKRLLAAMPPAIGIAFILVQHLDPGHPSLLVELLARSRR